MAYRIDFDNPLGEEVRRIASELLSAAADGLEKQPDGPHDAIHDARKSIKRTRALYRLIASEAGDFQAAENARLGDIARALSHLRDSAAIVETADYLEKETEGRPAKTAIRHFGSSMRKRRDALAGQKRDIAEQLAACRADLQDADRATRGLRLPQLRRQTIACIADGWRKTGRKADKALAACRQTADDEPFHDLRKRAQDRFMHAALLHSLWPSGMISIQRQAKALVDILGHEHDLSLLNVEVLGRDDLKADDRTLLLEAIATERVKLQEAARDAGEEIFDGKPKRDAKIVASLIRSRS